MKQVGDPGTLELIQTQAISIPANGYFYTYLTNFSDNIVSFDNLTIRRKNGVVRAIKEYYPYGLEYGRYNGSFSYNALDMYDKGYSSSEWHDREWLSTAGLDLNYFEARYYDPVLGRWHAPDPLEQCHSPYAGLVNDPANYVDPDGRMGWHMLCGLAKNGSQVFTTTLNISSTFSQTFGALGGLMSFVSTSASAIGTYRTLKTAVDFLSGGLNNAEMAQTWDTEREHTSSFNTNAEQNNSSKSNTSGPDDYIRNKKTNKVEYHFYVTSPLNTPLFYEYVGKSPGNLQSSRKLDIPEKPFEEFKTLIHLSNGLSLAGEFGAYNYNKRFNSMKSNYFESRNYRGKAHISNNGMIWRNVNNPKFLDNYVKTKFNYITRYNTIWGFSGAVLNIYDVSISFANSLGSESTSGKLYYLTEAYLKLPGFIPGQIGLFYNLAFDYTVRPVWHQGAQNYNSAIYQGSDPSIIFITPGLGYCPSIR